MPNPNSDIAVKPLVKRFNYTETHIKDRINNAIAFFKRLKVSYSADINIWVIDEPPIYSLYRFDNEMIIATFKHRKMKEISVPTFICDNSGTIFQFYQEEFNDLMERGRSIL